MDEQTRQQLIANITSAFEEAPYPGDDNIGAIPPDGDEVERDFRGKHWKELDFNILFINRDKLSFLTPAGFRFYLPAYLLIMMNYPYKADTLIDALPMNLAPLPDNRVPNRLTKNANAMNRNEKIAILDFINHYLDLLPEGYYNQYILDDLSRGKAFWANQIDL